MRPPLVTRHVAGTFHVEPAGRTAHDLAALSAAS